MMIFDFHNIIRIHTNIESSLKPNFMSFISLNMHFLQSLSNFIILIIEVRTYLLIYIWCQMLPSSIDTLLQVSKTTSLQKPFAYDCVTLYFEKLFYYILYLYEVRQEKKNISRFTTYQTYRPMDES